MSKTTDYQIQWTPELREAVDNRIIEYLLQGYSPQEAEEKAVLDLLDHTTFNFLDDVVVTAKAPEKKEVAVESDWDPGYTKFMLGERYYADQDHKNYLDWLRNDYTRGIRLATDKWGKGIGLGMMALAALPVVSGAAAGISTGLNAFKTAYPLVYNGIKTGLEVGFTIDGVRNTLSDNGVQKTYRIGKDIYQNGLTGQKAWDFTKSAVGDVLDIAGGVGLVGDVAKGAKWAKGAYIARLMNKALELPTSLVFNPDNMYRVIGSAGFEDAMLTGVLRNNINGRSTRGIYFTHGKVNDIDNPIKGFVRADGTLVKLPLDRVYLGDVIAEVPPTHLLFNLLLAHSHPEWSIFKSQNPISINGVKFYKRTSPNTYIELPHTPLMPQPLVYGNWSQSTNGFNMGYTTSGIKQTGTPTGNFHWREDITDIDNPVLLDVKPDMHYTRTHTTPVIKEMTNVDDMLLRIGIVPISNNPVLAVEQITVNPANRLVKVGERVDLTLSPNRVVQLEYQPRLIDNKGRLVSSDADRYFGIPTKTETRYTLWHKSGGTIKIKKKNIGSFTRYCKGKVTEECIRKGKNSSNPTTRKRANFAANTRKWKHEGGGNINYLNYFN